MPSALRLLEDRLKAAQYICITVIASAYFVVPAFAENSKWNHRSGGLHEFTTWLEDIRSILRISADPVMRTIVCRVPYGDFTDGAIAQATSIARPRLLRAAYELQNMGLIAVDHDGGNVRFRPASPSAGERMRAWAYEACANDDGCQAPDTGTAKQPEKKKEEKKMPGFEDPVAWSVHYDHPRRFEWQKPDEVLKLLQLKDGMVVADIGSGTGYFTVRLARAVPHGRVYAIDHEPNMLRYLEKRLVKEKIDNVSFIESGSDDPRIPAGVDVVLSVNAIPFIETDDRKRFIARMREQLRQGTRVVVIDWNDRDELSGQELADEMVAAGFKLLKHEKKMFSKQYALVLEN